MATNARSRRNRGHFMKRSASVFGNVVRIKAGQRHRTILQALLSLCPGTITRIRLAVIQRPQGGTVRVKPARAAGLPRRLRRCVAMWCDAQRRVAERCDAPRRVAYLDVDKSYASHRRPQHGAIASRLQDSAAAINVRHLFMMSRGYLMFRQAGTGLFA